MEKLDVDFDRDLGAVRGDYQISHRDKRSMVSLSTPAIYRSGNALLWWPFGFLLTAT